VANLSVVRKYCDRASRRVSVYRPTGDPVIIGCYSVCH